MKIELDRPDLVNIMVALNAVDVKGRDQMVTLLRLMQKIEDAVKEEDAKAKEAPKAE